MKRDKFDFADFYPASMERARLNVANAIKTVTEPFIARRKEMVGKDKP